MANYFKGNLCISRISSFSKLEIGTKKTHTSLSAWKAFVASNEPSIIQPINAVRTPAPNMDATQEILYFLYNPSSHSDVLFALTKNRNESWFWSELKIQNTQCYWFNHWLFLWKKKKNIWILTTYLQRRCPKVVDMWPAFYGLIKTSSATPSKIQPYAKLRTWPFVNRLTQISRKIPNSIAQRPLAMQLSLNWKLCTAFFYLGWCFRRLDEGKAMSSPVYSMAMAAFSRSLKIKWKLSVCKY